MENEGEELLPATEDDVLSTIFFALGQLTEFRSKIAGAADRRREHAADLILAQLKLAGFRLFRKPPQRGHAAFYRDPKGR